MASDLTVLAFDTSAAHCAAALIRGDTVLAATAEEMGRGQAERLMPLLEETLASAGLGWANLNRIGVGTGPGNFTGIRISVAAARGLALGLGVPAVGVSTLDAIRFLSPDCTAAVPAPRDMAYILPPDGEARMGQVADVPEAVFPPLPRELAIAMARLARDAEPGERPKPMYIKPADAAPSRDKGPVMLS